VWDMSSSSTRGEVVSQRLDRSLHSRHLHFESRFGLLLRYRADAYTDSIAAMVVPRNYSCPDLIAG